MGNYMSYRGNDRFLERLRIQIDSGGITAVHPPYLQQWRSLPQAMIGILDPLGDIPFSENRCRFQEGISVIAPGECRVIAPGVPHYFCNEDTGHLSTWAHARFLLEPNIDLFRLVRIPSVIRNPEAGRIRDLIREIVSAAPGSLSGAVSECRAAWALLEILLNAGTIDETFAAVGEAYLDFIPLLNYIHYHLEERLPLARLAARRNLSVSSLQKQFRRVLGDSPGEYILRCRLEKAVELLCQPGLRIAEIAERTGFSDPFAFGKAFRKRYRLSPGEYRKRLSPAVSPEN